MKYETFWIHIFANNNIPQHSGKITAMRAAPPHLTMSSVNKNLKNQTTQMGGVWFEPKTTRSQEMERLPLHHFTMCDGLIVVFFCINRGLGPCGSIGMVELLRRDHMAHDELVFPSVF
jgi:hypothetical protein